MAEQAPITREIPFESLVLSADPDFYKRKDYGYQFSNGVGKEAKNEDGIYQEPPA